MAVGTVVALQRTWPCSLYVLALSNPWRCIFCQMRTIQEGSPERHVRYQESEVLEKLMRAEEQLVSPNVNLKLPAFYLVETSTVLPRTGRMAPKGKLLPHAVL